MKIELPQIPKSISCHCRDCKTKLTLETLEDSKLVRSWYSDCFISCPICKRLIIIRNGEFKLWLKNFDEQK